MVLDSKFSNGSETNDCADRDFASALSRRPEVAAAPQCLVTQRKRGAYYTANSIADFIADWAIRSPGDIVLEPSFGGGVFLSAARDAAARKFGQRVRIIGAELSSVEADAAKKQWFGPGDLLHKGDFFLLRRREVNAVIGNPPFVRLRNLPSVEAARAIQACSGHLLGQMEASGSVWMPFVIAASRFLTRGGRLAFVLPFECTHVKYARPLWQYLGESFSSIQVLRSRERLFPDILQDVVLLLAEGFGGKTGSIVYSFSDKRAKLLSGEEARETIALSAVVAGSRQFQAVHATPLARKAIKKVAINLTQVETACRFNIGYVCGHKKFFHPSAAEVRKWKLQDSSFVSTIASGRRLNRSGLFTSSVHSEPERLFKPSFPLSRSEARYIAEGRSQGVDQRYKCRVRTPWHNVPDVRTPDLVLSVFSERPLLMINDAQFAVSNSLLAGFVIDPARRNEFVASWYTSLTLLSCETEVHALGGGLMVLIPGEVAKISIPSRVRCDEKHLMELDAALRAGDVEGAYQIGDKYVLSDQMGLTRRQIDSIRSSVREMSAWRNRSSSDIAG